MAKGDKTQKGLGGPAPHADQRTSEVPTSHQRANDGHQRENFGNGSIDASDAAPVSDPIGSERASGPMAKVTQRGMPIALERKVVTKMGIAPPSDRPPPPEAENSASVEDAASLGGTVSASGAVSNASDAARAARQARQAVASVPLGEDPDPYRTNPGFTPPPPLDSLQFEPSEEEQQRISSRDDLSPTDERSMSEGEADERSRFKTAPGGGRNRVSGGRAHASAYVSPSTVPPGHGTDHITSAIKVDEVVRNAVRAYETEPSLMRRRASSLPPLPQEKRDLNIHLIWGAAALGIGLAAFLIGSTIAGSKDEDADGGVAQAGSSRPDVAESDAPADPASLTRKSNAPSDGDSSDSTASGEASTGHASSGHASSGKVDVDSAGPSSNLAAPGTTSSLSDQKSAASASTPARTEPTLVAPLKRQTRSSETQTTPAVKSAAQPKTAPTSKAAPQTAPSSLPAAAPKPAPAPQPSSGTDPSNDLWLE